MKKLFFLFYTLCVGLFFSSCDDNNDNPVKNPIIDKTFSTADSNLELEVNDRILEDASVLLQNHDGNGIALITFKNTVLGYDSFETVTKVTTEGEKMMLHEKQVVDGFELLISGVVENGEMKLELTQTMATPITGKWFTHRLPATTEGGKGATVLKSEISTKQKQVMFMGQKVPPANVIKFLNTILGSTMYAGALDYVHFQENANVEIQFTKEKVGEVVEPTTLPDGVLIKEGDLKYYVKNKEVYIAISAHLVDMLKELAGDKIDFDALPLKPTAGYYGLPLLYNNDKYTAGGVLNQGNNASVYVNRKLMLPLMPIIHDLLPEDFAISGIKVKPIVKDLEVIMKDASEFTLGVRLAEKEYTEVAE